VTQEEWSVAAGDAVSKSWPVKVSAI